jgi:hypothetical protein
VGDLGECMAAECLLEAWANYSSNLRGFCRREKWCKFGSFEVSGITLANIREQLSTQFINLID